MLDKADVAYRSSRSPHPEKRRRVLGPGNATEALGSAMLRASSPRESSQGVATGSPAQHSRNAEVTKPQGKDQEQGQGQEHRGGPTGRPKLSVSHESEVDAENISKKTTRLPSAAARGFNSTLAIKNVVGLFEVGRGIRYHILSSSRSDWRDELGAGGEDLMNRLQPVTRHISYFPPGIVPYLHGRLHLSVLEHQQDNTDVRSEEELLIELNEIRRINGASIRCDMDQEGNAEWNGAVHSLVLRLALENASVGMRYVPNVSINPLYLPKHSSGLDAAGNTVDYVLLLDGSDAVFVPEDQDDTRLLSRIGEFITHGEASINHTNYFGIGLLPIAISIKTMTVDRTEEEARIDLGVWIASQILRIGALADEQRVGNDAAKKIDEILGRMLFPLILVQGPSWTVFFARSLSVDVRGGSEAARRSVNVEIYRGSVLGDSSTIEGIYQLIRSLRVLRDWVDSVFRGWWEEILLELESRPSASNIE